MYYTAEQVKTIWKETFAFIQVDEKDNVLSIKLDRAKKRNALTPSMVNEIAFAMAYAHYTPSVWTVVITANGPVFCAGADMKAFMGQEEAHNSSIPKSEENILLGELFLKSHKPCIAKVQGDAFAGAFLILCGCHYVLAAEEVNFGLPEVKRGIWPMQVMESLLQIIPARKVLDWCMLGKTLSCKEAFELGLVTHKANSSELDEITQQLIDKICSNSPSAIKYGLQAFDEIRTIENAQKHAYLSKMLGKVLKTDDAKEGINAFKEKRKPNWTGE